MIPLCTEFVNTPQSPVTTTIVVLWVVALPLLDVYTPPLVATIVTFVPMISATRKLGVRTFMLDATTTMLALRTLAVVPLDANILPFLVTIKTAALMTNATLN